MKSLTLAALLGLACFSVNAEPALSCDEVDEVGQALLDIGVAINDENAEIGEGTEEDTALAEIVTGLADIAEAEGDEDLANASVAMADAWQEMDRDAFTDALAEAVAKLAIVSAEDCGE